MKLTDLEFWNLLKNRLGIPYTFFEWEYDTTLKYVKDVSMREFSQYVPHKKYIRVTSADLVPDTHGDYKIPYDGEIITVINVLLPNSDIIAGFPINPIISGMDSAIDYSVRLQESAPGINMSSALQVGWELLDTGIIKLIPGRTIDSFLLEAEVAHIGFDTIPPRFGKDFIDLSIGSIKEAIGEVRSKYAEIQTPFGSIQLNHDTLKNEAETVRSRIIDRLNQLPPNIHVTN